LRSKKIPMPPPALIAAIAALMIVVQSIFVVIFYSDKTAGSSEWQKPTRQTVGKDRTVKSRA
jgi:hypothetical protein